MGGICKYEDSVGIRQSADWINSNEVTTEEYKTIFWDYNIVAGQQIYRNCKAKYFNQTEPEEGKVEILKQWMQVSDKFFESATEFVNQSIQLFDSFPVKVLTLDRSLLSFSTS